MLLWNPQPIPVFDPGTGFKAGGAKAGPEPAMSCGSAAKATGAMAAVEEIDAVVSVQEATATARKGRTSTLSMTNILRCQSYYLGHSR